MSVAGVIRHACLAGVVARYGAPERGAEAEGVAAAAG
jgi:hypothetical protein